MAPTPPSSFPPSLAVAARSGRLLAGVAVMGLLIALAILAVGLVLDWTTGLDLSTAARWGAAVLCASVAGLVLALLQTTGKVEAVLRTLTDGELETALQIPSPVLATDSMVRREQTRRQRPAVH